MCLQEIRKHKIAQNTENQNNKSSKIPYMLQYLPSETNLRLYSISAISFVKICICINIRSLLITKIPSICTSRL